MYIVQGMQYTKLTELVLKNNIQCKLYSRANFQFEFLARIGVCCPKLRVFDVFGTDTWADCLIALFFKDAFHSLHRLVIFHLFSYLRRCRGVYFCKNDPPPQRSYIVRSGKIKILFSLSLGETIFK